MKPIKKVMAVLAALALAILMCGPGVSAFAANTTTHTITITNDKAKHTYSAYQVFAGDISARKLTNIEWGTGVNGDALLTALKAIENSPYDNCESAEDVADVLAGFGENSEDLDAFAEVVGKHLATQAGTSSETQSPYTISVTGDGYYFVKDTGTIATDDAATKYILKVVGDVEVAAKPETPTIDKVIVNADSANGGEGKGTAVNVGDKVDFKLTSKVPAMHGYDSYTYIVNDTLSAGLTSVDADNNGEIDVVVTIGGTEYTDFTVTQNGQSFTITFNNFIDQKANAGKDIIITYSATLNEKALTTNVETNTAYLEYSNNPNDSTSKGKTPDKTVYVYDFDIVIDKYTGNETTGARLSGAMFVLMNSENKYYCNANDTVTWIDDKASATEVETDNNGAAKFEGLDAGNYKLIETVAPDGYNLAKEPFNVNITAVYDNAGLLISTSATPANNGHYQQVQPIVNKSGSTLPSTGGMGTTIFYIIGALLVLGAGITLVVRRRSSDK